MKSKRKTLKALMYSLVLALLLLCTLPLCPAGPSRFLHIWYIHGVTYNMQEALSSGKYQRQMATSHWSLALTHFDPPFLPSMWVTIGHIGSWFFLAFLQPICCHFLVYKYPKNRLTIFFTFSFNFLIKIH